MSLGARTLRNTYVTVERVERECLRVCLRRASEIDMAVSQLVSSYLTLGQSCALDAQHVAAVTLLHCNSTYFSLLAFKCICESCHAPFQAAGSGAARFCYHIPNCMQMRHCNDCNAPWNLVCDICDAGFVSNGNGACDAKKNWHWYGPLHWFAGLFRPSRLALPRPQSPRAFPSQAAAHAAAKVEEAKEAARVVATRAAEKAGAAKAKVEEAKEAARVVATRAAEKAGVAKEVAYERLAKMFDPVPANWIAESGVGEQWHHTQQATAGLGGHVPVQAYTDAALATISVLDLLSMHGSLSFARSDMHSNVNTLQLHADTAGSQSTLQGLIRAELQGGEPFEKLVADGRTALCSLLWLQRALSLLHLTLVLIESDRHLPVKDCLQLAYEANLKRFHGLVGRASFNVAARSAPERKAFVANLGPDEMTVFARLRSFLPDFGAVLQVNEEFLISVGAEQRSQARARMQALQDRLL